MKNPYLFEERFSPAISIGGKEEDIFAYYPPKPDLRMTDFLVGKSKVLEIKLPSGWMCAAVLKVKDARQRFRDSPYYKGTFFTDDEDDAPVELRFKITDIELKHLVRSPCGQSSPNPEWIKSDNALKWIRTDETLRIESGKSHYPLFCEKAYRDCLETGYIWEDGLSGYCAFVMGDITVAFYTEQIDTLEHYANSDADFPLAIVSGILPTGYTHTILFEDYKIECFAQFFKTPKPIKKQYDEYMETQRRLASVNIDPPHIKGGKERQNRTETKIRNFANCCVEARNDFPNEKIIPKAIEIYNEKYGKPPAITTAYRWKTKAEKMGILKPK